MDQGPPHKTRHTETNRKETGGNPCGHRHRGKVPEHNTKSLWLNRTPIVYAPRSRIDKWDLIKLQSFFKAKDTVKRTKQQPTNWEKIFSNPTSNRGLISNIYKEPKKLDTREPNNPIKEWGTEGAGEMAQQVRAPTALQKVLSSNPETTWWLTTIHNDALFWCVWRHLQCT